MAYVLQNPPPGEITGTVVINQTIDFTSLHSTMFIHNDTFSIVQYSNGNTKKVGQGVCAHVALVGSGRRCDPGLLVRPKTTAARAPR